MDALDAVNAPVGAAQDERQQQAESGQAAQPQPAWKTWQRDTDIPDRRLLIHQMCALRSTRGIRVHVCFTTVCAALMAAFAPQPEAVSAAQAERDQGVAVQAARLCAAPGGSFVQERAKQGVQRTHAREPACGRLPHLLRCHLIAQCFSRSGRGVASLTVASESKFCFPRSHSAGPRSARHRRRSSATCPR